MTTAQVLAEIADESAYLYGFVEHLLCLRCLDSIASNAPPEADLCEDCARQVLREDLYGEWGRRVIREAVAAAGELEPDPGSYKPGHDSNIPF